MTEDEEGVYRTLLPTVTEYKEYNSDLMPLRVLEVFKEAQKTKAMTGYEVWHQCKQVEKDPLLVGYKAESTDDWTMMATRNVKHFMIARWGEILEEFAILKTRAVDVLKSRKKARHQQNIYEAKDAIANSNLEMAAIDHLPDVDILKDAPEGRRGNLSIQALQRMQNRAIGRVMDQWVPMPAMPGVDSVQTMESGVAFQQKLIQAQMATTPSIFIPMPKELQ